MNRQFGQTRAARRYPLAAVRTGFLLLLSLAFVLAASSCGKAPEEAAATAATEAALEAASPTPSSTPEPTESELLAAGQTQLRLNAFFWESSAIWYSPIDSKIEFVVFTPESALYGRSDTVEEARSYLETGTVAGSVEIGKTLTYTVTQARYIPVRDLEGEYLASAVVRMRDPSGEIPDFSYDMDFYHRLLSKGDPNLPGYIEMKYLMSDYVEVSLEPAQSEPTLPYTVPDPVLYDCWVDESQWDDFTSRTAHTQNDIRFLFFWNDQVFVGKCASAEGLASVVYDYEGYNSKLAEVDGWHAFTAANPTYGWCGTTPKPYPYVDTADITINYADGSTEELHITQGSIIEWNGVRYRWTQRLEEEYLR